MEVLLKGGSSLGTPTGQSTSNDQSLGTHRKSSNTKKSTATGKTNVGFTFVDQSDDWKSLENKRIVSSQQRHTIRSHVMRSVRHNETMAGKKRPTGREGGRKAGDGHAHVNLPLSQAPPVSSSLIKSPRHTAASIQMTRLLKQQLSPKIPLSPSDYFDPFHSLPSQDAFVIVDNLTRYCFSTFIPMTFPVERDNNHEVQSRKSNVLQSRLQNPATFFGMMATMAVHRAIISGRHHDLKPSSHNHDDLLFDDDFKVMKAKAMSETRSRMKSGIMDEATIEAVFSLIGAASIVGNFEEARIHLKYMRQVLQGDNQPLDMTSPTTQWITITDVKAAMAMMGRPYYRLPWEPQSFSEVLIRKITPDKDANIRNLGHSFQIVGGLSVRIQELLQTGVQLCWFYQSINHVGKQLEPADHEAFRRKTLELEYDLLSYIWQGSPSAPDQVENDLLQTPIEQMIRMAVLGMLSNTFTHVLSAAGVGRALTQHQLRTTRDYMNSTHTHSRAAQECVVWAMLQYAHNAAGQVEDEIFIRVLANMCSSLNIRSWVGIEALCCNYLYVPAAQASSWKSIWKRAARINSIDTTSP